MIQIVKASAGSGKTFTLAKNYIRLLMASPDKYAYRHILAVTFTNKATEEMKSRILKELHQLAKEPEKSDYYKDMSAICSSESQLQAKAAEVLTNILHDYSAFSVSTIDKFFQRALKAFAREIGQFPSYKVELDKKSLIAESVDRMLDAIDENNRDLLNWLIDSASDSLDQGGKFNIDEGLYKAAEGIKSDNFNEMVKSGGIDVSAFYAKTNLTKIHQICKEYIEKYRKQVNEAAAAIRDAFQQAGVPLEETNQKFMLKVVNLGLNPRLEKFNSARESFFKYASDFLAEEPEATLMMKKAKKYEPMMDGQIRAALEEMAALLDEPYRLYLTFLIISKQTYNLGIVKEINDEFQALLKEKNVVSLDETNDILNRIISDTETPFIYEKLGVRFENFLLDEFQDTSVVQWNNFKPLLKESVANHHDNLIVGDVKQSIYRWRGGDWNLLANQVERDLPCQQPEPLSTNWRSSRNVIAFNNTFFQFALEALSQRDATMSQVLEDIYADVHQQISPAQQAQPESKAGSVEVTFTKDVLQETLLSIDRVLSVGGNYGQIAILVRNNKEGAVIAKELSSHGIPVISDDSLMVKSSALIARLVAMLYYVDSESGEYRKDTKRHQVNTFLAEQMAVEVPDSYSSLADLCESLLRKLEINNPDAFAKAVPYIEAFMDELKDWTDNNGNNLRSFLSHWEEVEPKLSSPESADAIRIFTVHKSKGLEFEYVIFPYTEKVDLYKSTTAWCVPDFQGITDAEKYEGLAKGTYQVNLSTGSADSAGADLTLFSAPYHKEYFLQTVDNLNLFYVALTRAKKGLHLISSFPSDDYRKEYKKQGGWDYTSRQNIYFNCLLFDFIQPRTTGFMIGQKDPGEPVVNMVSRDLPDHWKDTDYASVERESYFFGSFYPYADIVQKETGYQMAECTYPSYSLNPLVEGESGEPVRLDRLHFSSDALDFFGEEGLVGVEASPRIRGTVLHQILSLVIVPEDLDKAVMKVLRQGLITKEQAVQAKQFLEKAIGEVADRGWFPADGKGVRNEASIFDAFGRTYRPDRLLLEGETAVVIDYKFGDPEPQYRKQVSRYAGLLQQMGYKKVKAYLWYVGQDNDNIDEVI